MQCIVWNTWGPIESGAQYAFDWSESTVAMFANWGTVMFLLSVVPLSKMVEVMYTALSTVIIVKIYSPDVHCTHCAGRSAKNCPSRVWPDGRWHCLALWSKIYQQWDSLPDRVCSIVLFTILHFLHSCHACAILNGISGVTVMAAPPIISSTWFPASERTTATAINQVVCCYCHWLDSIRSCKCLLSLSYFRRQMLWGMA